MCGIAGLFDPNGSTSAERLAGQVASMTSTLTHRGPDGEGYWSDSEGRIFFGFRRLEVVGVGPGGSQPMHSADGRWVVTYNGEIYNHRSLRGRLAGEGLSFRGGSDTEVLVGAIQQWGLPAALEACEGMFAFALWDRKRRELHLVRDRFGEKPLYYGWVAGSLVFASELKALSVLPRFDPEIDRDAVALFLRHNCVPAPRTIYRHIAKLEPGELATFGTGARPGDRSAHRYWSARDLIEETRTRRVTDEPTAVADQLEMVLSDSVAARMVADVPIGAFLSGGVDSSLIVALMQRHSSSPVRTFTVGFVDRAFDESADAAKVAAHLGTDHTAMELRDVEAAEVIPALPDIWDEPFGDVSQIPMCLVSKLARTQVTVALSGDGGDELFAGYNRHAWLERLWLRSSALPVPVRRSAAAALGAIPPAFVEWVSGVAARRAWATTAEEHVVQSFQGGEGDGSVRWRGCLPLARVLLGRCRGDRRRCEDEGLGGLEARRVARARRDHRADAVARPHRLFAR